MLEPTEDTDLTVNVKFSKDLTIPVKISPDMTVQQIKDKLALELNIPQEELRIIFAGKELMDQTILQVSELRNCNNSESHSLPSRKLRFLPVSS